MTLRKSLSAGYLDSLRKPVTTLSLATKTFFLKEGLRQERTEWHWSQAWSKPGEYAAASTQGGQIRIEGELRNREYANSIR